MKAVVLMQLVGSNSYSYTHWLLEASQYNLSYPLNPGAVGVLRVLLKGNSVVVMREVFHLPHNPVSRINIG